LRAEPSVNNIIAKMTAQLQAADKQKGNVKFDLSYGLYSVLDYF